MLGGAAVEVRVELVCSQIYREPERRGEGGNPSGVPVDLALVDRGPVAGEAHRTSVESEEPREPAAEEDVVHDDPVDLSPRFYLTPQSLGGCLTIEIVPAPAAEPGRALGEENAVYVRVEVRVHAGLPGYVSFRVDTQAVHPEHFGPEGRIETFEEIGPFGTGVVAEVPRSEDFTRFGIRQQWTE